MSTDVENIIEELRSLDCDKLIELQSLNCYKFPNAKYFESNLSDIGEKGLLYPFAKDAVFEIPKRYFEEQLANISDLIFTDSSSEMDSLNTSYSFEENKTEMPYQVPEGYFQRLRPDFLEKEEQIIHKKEEHKIVALFQNVNKYVAAALILVLFSIGGNLMLRLKEQKKVYQMLNNMDINNELADVSTEEIFNYLNQSSSKNMEYLINPNGTPNMVNKVMINDKAQKGNQEEIQKASAVDILQYLSDEDNGF